MQRFRSVRVGTVVALAVLAGSTACTSSNNGATRTTSVVAEQTAPGTTDASTPPASPESTSATSANSAPTAGSTSGTLAEAGTPPDVTPLTDAGIQIVSSEGDAADGQPLRLTSIQADRLVADVGPGSGIVGSDLDNMAPVQAGTPPTSYLLAAWVSTGTSASAETARGWMGDQDWTAAPTLHFPLAAVAMFVNEMAMDTSQLRPATAGSTPTTDSATTAAPDAGTIDTAPAGFVARPAGLAVAPCSAVTGFLSSVINGLFDALKINPSATGGGGVFDFVTSALATVWNVALGLAQGALEGLISTLTAPIFNAIRVAVGALGVATVVVSYFRDQTLDVMLESPQTSEDQYPFAVGGGADVMGKFVAKGRQLTGDWPAAVIDCANVAGANLPELIKPGSPTNWAVDSPGLIVPGQLSGEVMSDKTATLTFTTGRESEEDAKGEPNYGIAYVTVKIPRKEVEDFLDLARAQVNGLRAQLLAAVPKLAQPAVNSLLAATVDPTVKEISNEIAGAAGGVFAVQGTGIVTVLHHSPPDTTIPEPTTPPTEPTQGGDFCTGYAALVAWVAANPPGDVASWAAEIVNRLNALPEAPAEVAGSVAVLLDVYTAVAANAGVVVLEQKAAALQAASATLGSFCGLG